jgi:neutral ceramidase
MPALVRICLSSAVAGGLIAALVLVAVPAAGADELFVPPECEVTLCAGGGRGDVTPPVTSPLWGYADRAGYAHPQEWLDQRFSGIDTDLYTKGIFLRSEGYHTRLYARSIVLRNAEGGLLVFVQTDLGHVPGEVFRAVSDELASLGIPREALLLSATHTHGGPGAFHQQGLSAALVGDNYDPRIVGRVVDGIVASVTAAVDSLAPAQAALGQTEVLGVQGNRSLDAHRRNPCPDPLAVDDGTDCSAGGGPQAAEHVDPWGTMLRVDRADGVPIGVWTSVAVHGTVFGPGLLMTADNQGVAERVIEEGIRERAAARGALPPGWDVVAAYANGSQGDINPFCPGHSGIPTGYDAFACSESLGRIQAEAFLGLYDELEPSLSDELALDARIDVMLMNGDGDTSPLAVLGGGPTCAAAGLLPRQGEKCPLALLNGTGAQWFWISTMRIGDTILANVPGEMTVQMARRVRAQIVDSPANVGADGRPVVDRAIVVGLANDYLGYLTTPEEYSAQAYEGTFTFFGPQQGPYVADRLQALSDALLRGEDVALSFPPPDTSFTRSGNVSPATQALSAVTDGGSPAGTELEQPEQDVVRGAVAAFTWAGGQPSAEVQPGEVFVTVERHDRGWHAVEDDADLGTVVRHFRDRLDDRWTAEWDVPFDAQAGRYRFRVTGYSYDGGALEPYEVASRPFTVGPSGGLVVASAESSAGRVLVTGAYPEGDHDRSFRLRPAAVTSGLVSVLVRHADGTTSQGSGGYVPEAGAFVVDVPAAAAGDTVEVPVGGLVDEAGNTNG